MASNRLLEASLACLSMNRAWPNSGGETDGGPGPEWRIGGEPYLGAEGDSAVGFKGRGSRSCGPMPGITDGDHS
jgi:hypothetical protein